MRFENQFAVDAPIEQVWTALLDVERVAPTVPGAQVLERIGDDAYKVAIKVKVGPMSMTYRGEVEITERDETAHRAVMKARAKESRGQGMADADVTMVLRGDDGRTSATVTTDVELSGKVATMGQGVLQDVSGRLVQTFADNLAAMLEGGAEPASSGGHARTAETGTGAASTHGEPDASASTGQTAQTATGAAPRGEASAAGSTVQAKSAAELAAAGAGAAGPSAGAAGAGLSAGAAGAGGEGAGAPAASVGTAGGSPAGPSTGAAGGGAARTAPRRAPEDDALDLGSIGGAVIADRLRDPRALAGVLAAVALVSFLLGRRSAG